MAPRSSLRRKAFVISDDEDNGDDGGDRSGSENNNKNKNDTDKNNKRNKKNENENDDESESALSRRGSNRTAGKLRPIRRGTVSKPTTLREQSPPKSKPKARSGGSKEPPKPRGNPIYSFFNATTQRQRTSQPSASPEKVTTPQDEVEAIHDDFCDAKTLTTFASTTLSKGSSTALALRKRKFQRTLSLEDEEERPSGASQKFRKATCGDRMFPFPLTNDDKRPWTEQFAPVDLTELALHKRKVADVRSWLEITYRGKQRKVLVLKGVAGCGKTTTTRLLAKELEIELIEWRQPDSSEYSLQGNLAPATHFEEFIFRAGKVSSLTLSTDREACAKHPESQPFQENGGAGDRRQALLVEEFPSTFFKISSTLQSFRSAIAQYVSTTVPPNVTPVPIIIIISETLLSTNTAAADSFTAHRLLGPELITNPYINTIEFNPVAPTYLIKALEMVVVKEARKTGRRRTPGTQVLRQLAETGDIRSAVSSLEFLCLRGDEGNTWSNKVTFTKPKQAKPQTPLTKAEEDALKLITNRESTLGIFHSVGKVVYNKRTDAPVGSPLPQPPDWLPQHQRSKIPETNLDSIIDELGTDTSTFIAALHENYALSCSGATPEKSLDSLSGCLENLSDSDLLSLDHFSSSVRAFPASATDTLRQDEMCFQVAVRGLLFHLPHPVHRSHGKTGSRADAHRMLYPASLRLWRRKEELEGKLEVLMRKLAADSGGIAGPKRRVHDTSTGVESWKNSGAFTSRPALDETENVPIPPRPNIENKHELLVDRLPFLAQILSAPGAPLASQTFRDLVTTLARLDRLPLPSEEEEDDGGNYPPDTEEAAPHAEQQWTTERSEADWGHHKLNNKKISTKNMATPRASDDGITLLPMQSQRENLVLEDDDIED